MDREFFGFLAPSSYTTTAAAAAAAAATTTPLLLLRLWRVASAVRLHGRGYRRRLPSRSSDIHLYLTPAVRGASHSTMRKMDFRVRSCCVMWYYVRHEPTKGVVFETHGPYDTAHQRPRPCVPLRNAVVRTCSVGGA